MILRIFVEGGAPGSIKARCRESFSTFSGKSCHTIRSQLWLRAADWMPTMTSVWQSARMMGTITCCLSIPRS